MSTFSELDGPHPQKHEAGSNRPFFSIIDSARDRNFPDRLKLHTKIVEKKRRTEASVSDGTPRFLSEPHIWRGQREEIQRTVGGWISDILVRVYGENCQLPDADPDVSIGRIRRGEILPYFGVVVPNSTDASSLKDSEVVAVEGVKPVVVSTILPKPDGFAELGRSAKDSSVRGFEGGAVLMQRIEDWLSNSHGLMAQIHTMRSNVRAAGSHNDLPSSTPIQKLVLDELGLRIRATAPLSYNKGLEPYLSVARSRDREHVQALNRDARIFTFPGEHIPLLHALWEHQLEQPVAIEVAETFAFGYRRAIVSDEGDKRKGTMEVITEESHVLFDSRVLRISDAIAELAESSPATFVKIPAHEPQSVVTQKKLAEAGFVVCGVEPGRDERYVDQDGTLQHYESPPSVYMTGLGRRLHSGSARLLEPNYPGPESTHGVDLHGPELRGELYRVHHRLVRTLGSK